MSIPWATNILHFHLNKLFEKGFVIWVLFCLATVLATFQNTGRFFSKASGHPGYGFQSGALIKKNIPLPGCQTERPNKISIVAV
jgi:hypothetical protein